MTLEKLDKDFSPLLIKCATIQQTIPADRKEVEHHKIKQIACGEEKRAKCTAVGDGATTPAARQSGPHTALIEMPNIK